MSLTSLIKNLRLPLPYILVLASVILSFFIHHGLSGSILSEFSISFIVNTMAPVFFGCMMYSLVKYVDINIFIKYLKFFVALSVFFVFLQIIGIWTINLIFFSNTFVEMVASKQGSAGYLGVSSSPFYMASQLAIITPVIISRSIRQKVGNFFFLVFAYVSGQRAYFITVLLNIIRNKVKIKILLLIVLVSFSMVVFLLFSGGGGVLFRGYDLDRVVLWLAGINYILNVPTGVGSLPYYSETVTSVLQDYPFFMIYEELLINSAPHNALINVAIINGVWILVPSLYLIYAAYKKGNAFSWGFLFGVAVSMFHNLSFLYADYWSWIILAFAFHYISSPKKLDG